MCQVSLCHAGGTGEFSALILLMVLISSTNPVQSNNLFGLMKCQAFKCAENCSTNILWEGDLVGFLD